MIERIGVELEVFISDEETGQFVDILPWIDRMRIGYSGKGDYTTDAGERGHLELISSPTLPENILLELQDMVANLPRHWVAHHVVRRPGSVPEHPSHWVPRARYRALQEALRQECGGDERWRGVLRMSDLSASHITYEIDPYTVAGTMLANYLNLIGPFFAGQFCKKFGIDNRGHLAAWFGWARVDRLPTPRWFESPQEMKRAFTSLPRLVRGVGPKEGDQWEVDLVSSHEVGNKADEGQTYWMLRPKRSFQINGSPGGLEDRTLPSMSIELLSLAAKLKYGIASEFCVQLERINGGDSYPTPHAAQELFWRVAVACADWEELIPPRPPTADEWYTEIIRQTW